MDRRQYSLPQPGAHKECVCWEVLIVYRVWQAADNGAAYSSRDGAGFGAAVEGFEACNLVRGFFDVLYVLRVNIQRKNKTQQHIRRIDSINKIHHKIRVLNSRLTCHSRMPQPHILLKPGAPGSIANGDDVVLGDQGSKLGKVLRVLGRQCSGVVDASGNDVGCVCGVAEDVDAGGPGEHFF